MEPTEVPSFLIKYFAPAALGAEPTRVISVANANSSFFPRDFTISE
jgi:hypothetical protein